MAGAEGLKAALQPPGSNCQQQSAAPRFAPHISRIDSQSAAMTTAARSASVFLVIVHCRRTVHREPFCPAACAFEDADNQLEQWWQTSTNSGPREMNAS